MNKKYHRYGTLLYYVIRFIEKTMKITEIYPENFNKDENFILTFWHNKLVMTLFVAGFIKRRVGLASPSKDGELISVPLERYGTEMVRGSSGKDSVKGLLLLIKKIKEGGSVGTPVDGPKGPIYEVKSGMLYLAQKSGKPIVPMGVAYSDKWVFKKAWDKFQLPKPFSKAVAVFGEQYYIDADADLALEALVLKDKIDALDKKAAVELEKIMKR